MKYTALTFNQAPKLSGVYKITYLSNQSVYVGVTKDLRMRFYTYHRFSNAPQWRLKQCKDNRLAETFSLQNVFKMTMFLYEYEILKCFASNVSNTVLRRAEKYHYDFLKPELNMTCPNYLK